MMGKHRFGALGLILLVICLLNLVSFYRMTANPHYTTCRLTTDAGATVHSRIEGNRYGSPLDGDYLVHGPKGEYIGVANVQERILGTGVLVAAALILIAVSGMKHRTDAAQNKASEDIDAGAPNPQR